MRRVWVLRRMLWLRAATAKAGGADTAAATTSAAVITVTSAAFCNGSHCRPAWAAGDCRGGRAVLREAKVAAWAAAAVPAAANTAS